MNKSYLIIPDQHAHPNFNNDRADWLGKFMYDVKPDVVVNMGDAADMESLSNYKSISDFSSVSYGKDIDAHLDFQDRLWHKFRKAKKKQPYKVVLHGNHEDRLRKVLKESPHLAGERFGLSFKNYQFSDYYHEQIPYEGNTPGVFTSDGVNFAHYFVSGIMGRPISGEHHATSLINKYHGSCVCSHSHLADWSIRTDSNDRKIMGLVAGCYQDYESTWAGRTNKMWWRGVVMLYGVDHGEFDPEFISLQRIRREYNK